MNKKHTQGEWSMIYTDTIDQPKKSLLSIHSRGKVIAKIYGDVEELEEEQNARLIAAAPELLKALINLTSKCNILPNSQCPENENPYGDALQAIKKATE